MRRAAKVDAKAISYRFEILGECPSKKNGRGLNRGRVFDATKGQQAPLLLQLRNQWARYNRPTIERCRIAWLIEYTNPRQDGDGVETTMLDLLQKAGIIRNDNMGRYADCTRRCVKAERFRVVVEIAEVGE